MSASYTIPIYYFLVLAANTHGLQLVHRVPVESGGQVHHAVRPDGERRQSSWPFQDSAEHAADRE